MTITSYPYDAGAGADITENQWREFARLFRPNGVIPDQLNKFEVYADDSGMQVKVKSGQAWIEGQFVESDAEEVKAITAADATNPRKDLVVLRNNFTANAISIVVIAGTPAGSPSAPSLTQSTTIWDIPLAIVDVAASETSIESTHVTDDRMMSGGLGRAEAATELTIASGAITRIGQSHKLQPESGTTDDLDTINGGDEGDVLILYASDAGTDTITIKHGTGNISCFGGSDLELSEGAVLAYYDGTEWKAMGGGSGGGTSLTNSNISPTTANVSATVNNRYFADISGLTANRNFVVPAGAVGDEIELSITVGDADFELIIIGDTGISINGGTAATEWSRVFISGEVVRLVANSTSNWQVVEDGRIPALAHFQRTGSNGNTTHSAATPIKADWNNLNIDVGGAGDLTNDQFLCRRAGKYMVSGAYSPAAGIADQKYAIVQVQKNSTQVAAGGPRQSTSGTSTIVLALISPTPVSCAAGDTLTYYFQTEDANMGLGRTDSGNAVQGQTFFAVLEVLPQ